VAAEHFDVIIVGAGLSGLSAAKALADKGRKVVVLEARDRVGGRTWRVDGFDLGAGYIGTDHTALVALGKSLGLDMTFPVKGSPPPAGSDIEATWDTGKAVLYLNGKRTTGDADSVVPPGLGLFTLGRLWLMMQEIDRDCNSLKAFAANPWEHPKAAAWDAMSVEGWLDQGFLETADDQELIRMCCRSIWSVEAPEMSFLYFLWYIAINGGLDDISSPAPKPDSAQGFRLFNGTQQLAELLAANLKVVRFNMPAQRISQDASGVTVTAADGSQFSAPRAIVAMSPAMSAVPIYDPPLPDGRTQLCQRAAMGRTMKCFFTYPTAFWRPAYSGLCNCNLAPLAWVMDCGKTDGTPALMCFVVGAQADRLAPMSDAQRVAEITAAFAKIFADDRALAPTGHLIQDWAQEQWTRGCPVSIMPPNALTSFGRYLRAPSGRIHWAGTETATAFAGYMEGAIRAGYDRAAEVLALL